MNRILGLGKKVLASAIVMGTLLTGPIVETPMSKAAASVALSLNAQEQAELASFWSPI